MLRLPLLAALAGVLTPGLAEAQEAQREGVFTFVAPADNDPRLEEFACGVRFGMRQVISNVEGGRYGELKRTGDATAELTTFVGSQDFTVGKGMRHEVGVAVDKSADYCSVALHIRSAEPFKKGLVNLWKPPTFTAADVLLQTKQFFYRPSFTSEFPASSLLANFDRLAAKGCSNVGFPASRSIPSDMSGGFDKVYCIKTAQGYVPAVPECAPYRNGTRCTVLAVLDAERQGNTIDARPSAREFRSAVEAILKD